MIGESVNEATRLCELAKSHPGPVLATAIALQLTSENECAQWRLGETVTLHEHGNPTQPGVAHLSRQTWLTLGEA
uniref:B1549_F3_145 n=1 Tax=Mycobacterium leprae TaxID=1769 RepID=Q49718_MYCLR|nr:B1549_F3_145 [Mycobacterium leprae]